MPHLSLEYSGNLDNALDMSALCASLGDVLYGSGLFERGAIRVRAFSATAWAIADGQPEDAFVDMQLRIGEGRSTEEKQHLGRVLFDKATAILSDVFNEPHFALSLEIREIDPAFSWRKNTIHHRFRT